MQDNITPDSHLEENSEEVVFPETKEIGEEIFERYEEEAPETKPEDLAPLAVEEHHEALAATEETTEDAGNHVLHEVLHNEENFETTVANASPNELVLLMEAIAREADVKLMLAKVPIVRKAFEKFQTEHPDENLGAISSRLNTAMAKFNRKRSEYFSQQEKAKEENTKLKQELLDKLKKIVEEEKVTALQEVREIQNRWKEIGWVSNEQKEAINETYKYYLDLFYSQRGKYIELRDLDRKHNLDEKLKIIREIESLIPAEADLGRESWNIYSQKLKNLKEIWRTIGGVPKENAEEINEKLKNALDSFYAIRQEYYHAQDSLKEENAALKIELLSRLKPFETYTSDKAKEWNHITNEVLKLQEEWKKLGPAPFEKNRELWQEYRKICDAFFEHKGAYFTKFDEERNENYRKKLAICEQAESLMNNENFKEVADLLRKLQADWKEIGPVHERFSAKIWKRFRTACDTFFKRRQEQFQQGLEEQNVNLAAKQEIINAIKGFIESGEFSAHVEEVKELQAKWKTIGHVPFAEKEKVNQEFRETADAFFNHLHSRSGGPRSGGNNGRSGGQQNQNRKPKVEKKTEEVFEGDEATRKVKSNISRLKEKLTAAKEKFDSYSTNIQLISKGKSGDGLRKMIQLQIDEEKASISKIEAEIKALNDSLKKAAAKPEEKTEAPAAENPVVESNTVEEATNPEV